MIQKYDESYQKAWDRFVLQESGNGTFLQTRNFLNYHAPEKFIDHSVLVMKGTNITAVIPANIITEDGRKIMVSHMGSTFGGIVLGKNNRKIVDVEMVFNELQEYLREEKIHKIILKMTGDLYCRQNMDILYYYLNMNGFQADFEMGYYIDFSNFADPIESHFDSSRRRHFKSSLAHDPEFRRIEADSEVKEFYQLLCKNMKKFDTMPVHTLDEVLDLKNNRLKDIISFYGVYMGTEMIAGSMMFTFGDKEVAHTQYLATDQEKLSFYPSEFLYYSLIKHAKEQGYRRLSFGTATLEHGKVLNKGLAQFKEGFGTETYINQIYYKIIL